MLCGQWTDELPYVRHLEKAAAKASAQVAKAAERAGAGAGAGASASAGDSAGAGAGESADAAAAAAVDVGELGGDADASTSGVAQPPAKKRARQMRGGGGTGRLVNTGGFTGTAPSADSAWAEANTPGKLIRNRTSGFRGDARWVGSDVVRRDGKDFVVAISEAGSLYVAWDAAKLNDGFV